MLNVMLHSGIMYGRDGFDFVSYNNNNNNNNNNNKYNNKNGFRSKVTKSSYVMLQTLIA